MNENMKLWLIFLRSLLLTCLVAGVVGGGIGYMTTSVKFGFIGFVMSMVVQISMASIVNGISAKRNEQAEFLAQQVLKEASERKMPYILNCAYCNTVNKAGISFVDENTFVCSSCNQLNKVYIQFSTTRVTTPLSVNKEELMMLNMEEDTGVRQTAINDKIQVN